MKRKKILILINDSFPELKDSIINRFDKLKNNYDLVFMENYSSDLIKNAEIYINNFEREAYDFGFIIWITGVAFTNLLTKKIINKNIFNTSSQFYFEDYLKTMKEIDILVLGATTLGIKNIKLISDLYIQHLIERIE